MLTACKSKVINNTVYIPKEWNFHADEVFINKIGDVLMITPVERLAEAFERGAATLASLDFMKAGRPAEIPAVREELEL